MYLARFGTGMIVSFNGDRVVIIAKQAKPVNFDLNELKKGDCVDYELVPGTNVVSRMEWKTNNCTGRTRDVSDTTETVRYKFI